MPIHLYVVYGCFHIELQTWMVAVKTVYLSKAKTYIIWPFIEKVAVSFSSDMYGELKLTCHHSTPPNKKNSWTHWKSMTLCSFCLTVEVRGQTASEIWREAQTEDDSQGHLTEDRTGRNVSIGQIAGG